MLLAGHIQDCACGLRYMRSVVDLVNIEAGQALCPCARVLGEWNGKQRLVFEPEEWAEPETFH